MFQNPGPRFHQFSHQTDFQLQNYELQDPNPEYCYFPSQNFPEQICYESYEVVDSALKPPAEIREQKPLTLEEIRKLAKAEKRKKRRATLKYRTLHASRERIRVESFNKAFGELRGLLPTTPADKKLSKIEILRVSISYIRYLEDLLLLN